MGRPVQQRQGAAQRPGAERRRILVSSYGIKVYNVGTWKPSPTRPEDVVRYAALNGSNF